MIKENWTSDTGHEPGSDSDEESTEGEVEPAVDILSLRERRVPCRFPDEERVLLTDEGEPESLRKQRRMPTTQVVECHSE